MFIIKTLGFSFELFPISRLVLIFTLTKIKNKDNWYRSTKHLISRLVLVLVLKEKLNEKFYPTWQRLYVCLWKYQVQAPLCHTDTLWHSSQPACPVVTTATTSPSLCWFCIKLLDLLEAPRSHCNNRGMVERWIISFGTEAHLVLKLQFFYSY